MPLAANARGLLTGDDQQSHREVAGRWKIRRRREEERGRGLFTPGDIIERL